MISANAKIWIWISLAVGYNNPKVKLLYEKYDDIAQFYNGGITEWKRCGLFTATALNKLSGGCYMKKADEIIDECMRFGYSVLSIDDEKFPKCILNIDSPPAVLYINGKLPDADNRLTIGIVGTRKATRYGINNATKISNSLSRCGVAIVSGEAVGIDSAAHQGVLAAEGVSILIRGCGLNAPYLKENEQLRKAVSRRGAIITEYAPNENARGYHFPARNRLISALSDGVVIVEAGKKSGALITASLALEQGKEVFALLGNNTAQNEGSNNRIKEGSAIAITDYKDILLSFDNLYVTNDVEDFCDDKKPDRIPVSMNTKGRRSGVKEYFSDFNPLAVSVSDIVDDAEGAALDKEEPKKEEIKKKKEKKLNLNATAQKVYDFLTLEPVHIDEISNELQIPVFKLLSTVTELEMRGLIEAVSGRRYRLKQTED